MDYKLVRDVKSKVIPGVVFTLRSVSRSVRLQIDMETAESAYRIGELQRELASIGAGQDKDPTDDRRRYEILTKISDISRRDIEPVWVRFCLERITGLTIGGNHPDHETLLTHGPSRLIEEIIAEINADGLTEEEAKNSESPTTSMPQVAGRLANSTVDDVRDRETISSEIVDDIFPIR